MTFQLISDVIPRHYRHDSEDFSTKFTHVEKTGSIPLDYKFDVENFLIYVIGVVANKCKVIDHDPVKNIFKLEGHKEYGLSDRDVEFLISILFFILSGKQITTRQVSYLRKVVSQNVIKSLNIDEDSIVEITEENTKNGFRKTVEKIKEVVYIGDGKYCVRFPYDDKINQAMKKICQGYCIELGGHIGIVGSLTAMNIEYFEKNNFKIDNIVILGRDLCMNDNDEVIVDLDGDNLIAYSNTGKIGKYVNLLIETGNI